MDSYLQFKRPGRNCLVCGASLPELERHPSMLKLDSKEDAVRQDICPECWEKMAEKNYFSYWITRRYQQGPSAEERRLAKSERNEALWALFNALYARTDREELAAQLFLISHLLMKYRVLSYLGPDEEGRLRFYHSGTQETYLVPDLPLDAVSFVDIMEEVDGQLREYAPRAEEAAGQED